MVLGVFKPKNLNEGLRILWERTGLTIPELARLCGLGASTMHNYLRQPEKGGRIPGVRELRGICRVLAEELQMDADALWTQLGQLSDESI